jgi:hypothetical protein
MTSTEPIGGARPPIVLPPSSTDPAAPTLPTPSSLGMEPRDALGQMLAMMERMGQLSTEHTEQRIRDNQKQARQAFQDFLRKLAESIEAAKRAAEEEDDGGLFSDIADCVGDIAGAIVGTVIDFVKDTVEAPFELTVGLAKNLTDPQGMLAVMKGQLIEMSTNGETADTVKGFTRGVVKFSADLAKFGVKFAEAMARGLDPEAAWESVKADAEQLWKSFQTNVLENPDFMAVMAAVAKAAAVAGAVMSGGTLAWVAVAVFLVCEADNRYGFVEDVVGKDAAPWVRLGMQAAGCALLAGAAGTSSGQAVLKWIQAGTAVVGGASSINAGIRMLEEGDRQADELERKADIKAILNRMQQLQRLLDSLIELLEEQVDDRKTNIELGNRLVQTQAATESGAVMRG